MKTTMKLFAALTIMLGFSLTGLGQATNTISANASVFSSAAITNVHNLEFGFLTTTGGAKSVALDGAATGGIGGFTESQGIFKVTRPYNAAQSTQLTLTFPVSLSGSQAGTVLPLSNNIASYTTNATSGLISATDFNATTAQSLTVEVPTSNTDPVLYVHVGGTVTPGGSTLAGVYTGTITLTSTLN